MAIDAGAVTTDPSPGLDLASIRERLKATVIDGLVLTVAFALLFALALPVLGDLGFATPGLGIIFLVGGCVLMEGCYDAGMTAWWGRSLGKMVTKSKVVNHDGTPVSAQQAWLRGFLKYAMVTTYLLAIVDGLMMLSRGRATLLDRITQTRVIRAA